MRRYWCLTLADSTISLSQDVCEITMFMQEIKPYETPLEEIKAAGYKGIIFTGGPNSVYDMTSPHYDKAILDIGIPVLGICYGCQLISWMADGKVESCKKSEYGKIEITVSAESKAFQGRS